MGAGKNLYHTRRHHHSGVNDPVMVSQQLPWRTFENATQPPIYYSIAGHLGRLLEFVFAPIGFNWQICIALVPGLAAREVALPHLAPSMPCRNPAMSLSSMLEPLIAQSWSLPTALSLLAWYVFAPQCIATLSVVRRETNTLRYPVLMAAYLALPILRLLLRIDWRYFLPGLNHVTNGNHFSDFIFSVGLSLTEMDASVCQKKYRSS